MDLTPELLDHLDPKHRLVSISAITTIIKQFYFASAIRKNTDGGPPSPSFGLAEALVDPVTQREPQENHQPAAAFNATTPIREIPGAFCSAALGFDPPAFGVVFGP